MPKRILSLLVASLFLINNIAYALSPQPGSTQPGTKAEMYALGQKLFAAKVGPGSIDFDTYRPIAFIGKELLDGPKVRMYLEDLRVKFIPADYDHPPKGWENNPILKETDLINALKAFRDKEAMIPADFLDIQEGWFPVDEANGELPIARIERIGEDKYVLIIHTKFVQIWNHIRKNDVWFEADLGAYDRRTVSVAWGMFKRLASHEMAELSRYFNKSSGHVGIVRNMGEMGYSPYVDDNEESANTIKGRYALMNEAIWMWALGSYCFADTTRYNNYTFRQRLQWIFKDKEALKLGLNMEFPRLSTYEYARTLAIAIACAINYNFFSRLGMEMPSYILNPQFQSDYEEREKARRIAGITEPHIYATGGGAQKMRIERIRSSIAELGTAITELYKADSEHVKLLWPQIEASRHRGTREGELRYAELCEKAGQKAEEIKSLRRMVKGLWRRFSNRSFPTEYDEAVKELVYAELELKIAKGSQIQARKKRVEKAQNKLTTLREKIIAQLTSQSEVSAGDKGKTPVETQPAIVAGQESAHIMKVAEKYKLSNDLTAIAILTDARRATGNMTETKRLIRELATSVKSLNRSTGLAAAIIKEAQIMLGMAAPEGPAHVATSSIQPNAMTAEAQRAILSAIPQLIPAAMVILSDPDVQTLNPSVSTNFEGRRIRIAIQNPTTSKEDMMGYYIERLIIEGKSAYRVTPFRNQTLYHSSWNVRKPAELLRMTQLTLQEEKRMSEWKEWVEAARAKAAAAAPAEASAGDYYSKLTPEEQKHIDGIAARYKGDSPRIKNTLARVKLLKPEEINASRAGISRDLGIPREDLTDLIVDVRWPITSLRTTYYRQLSKPEKGRVDSILSERGFYNKNDNIKEELSRIRRLPEITPEDIQGLAGLIDKTLEETQALIIILRKPLMMTASKEPGFEGAATPKIGQDELSTTQPAAAEHPFVKIISDYIISIGRDIGPGSETPLVGDLESIYRTIQILRENQIEVLMPQDIGLTEDMQVALRDARRRDGRDVINCRLYLTSNDLKRILKQEAQPGVKRIVITDNMAKDQIEYLSLTSPEIFRNIRLLNITLPTNYHEVRTNAKTVFQARMIAMAVFARLLERDKTPMVEAILRDMLRGALDVDETGLDEFIRRMGEPEESTAGIGQIRERIAYFLGKSVSLIEKLGRELQLMKAFWTAA